MSSAHVAKSEPKFKTWKDVPDSMVPIPTRDPDNPIYRSPNWMRLKKKQIWASQINRPVYLLFDIDKYIIGALLIAMCIIQGYLYYDFIKEEVEAVSRPSQ